MDPITHALLGHALGTVAAVAGDAEPLRTAAYWAAFASSSLPDVDFVVYFWGGRTAFLKHHATWTHSPVIGIPGSLAVAAVSHRLWPGTSFWVAWAWSALAWALHVFIDLFNSEGTMAGWPWSRRRIAWDVLFIVDPLILGILLVPPLARHVAGARDAAAIASVSRWTLVAVAAYVALRTMNHARALRLARAALLAESGGDQRRVTVLPLAFGLCTWSFVVRNAGDYRLGNIDAISGEVYAERDLRADRHPAVEASRSDQSVADFLDFARYPLPQVEPRHGATVVRWRDARFLFRGLGSSGLEAVVTLRGDEANRG